MKRDEKGEHFYTVIDLTKALGVGESCIRRLLKEGKLEYSKEPGGFRNRIYPEQLKKMIKLYGCPVRKEPATPHRRHG